MFRFRFVFLSVFRRFAMRGVPQKAPGDLPGQPWGTWWPGVQFLVIFGHLLAPLAPRWPPRALPWRPPEHPRLHFYAHFCRQCFMDVAVGGRGAQQEAPGGCKCWFYIINTDVLRRWAFGAQGAKKASPGCPGTCFWHLFGTFWITLASLSPPVATLRPHFHTPVTPLAF